MAMKQVSRRSFIKNAGGTGDRPLGISAHGYAGKT